MFETPRYISQLGATDWDQNTDEWDANQYALEFWNRAQAYTVKRWGHLSSYHPTLQHDDLASMAVEILILRSRKWFEWCEETDANPTEKRLFWWFVKQQIDWDVKDYVTFKTVHQAVSVELAEGDVDGTLGQAEWIATQIQRSMPASQLHADLADYIPTLPLKHQMCLALSYFEELAQRDIAPLTGLIQVSVSSAIKQATTRVMNQAQRLVLDTPPPVIPGGFRPWLPPQELIDWIHDRYDTDPMTYLRYVQLHYAADVTYVRDMLENANGTMHPKDTAPRAETFRAGQHGKLKDADIETIRQRLEAGDTHTAIAADYEVARQTISKINTGYRTTSAA